MNDPIEVTPKTARLNVESAEQSQFASLVITPAKPNSLFRPSTRGKWRIYPRWKGLRGWLARHASWLLDTPILPAMAGGAAGAWTFTNGGRTSLLNGTFDIDTDSWKMALFLSTSNIGAASTTYAGVTNEVANAFDYTTGGIAITLTLAGTTTVTVDISVDPVWTAAGGSITARFAVIYEVGGNVLCYALLDSAPADVTATDGNTLTIAASASGVFTLA